MTLKRIIFWHYRKYDFIVIKAEYGILKSRWGLYIFYNFYFCFLSLYELFIFHLNECAFFRKVIIRIYASFFYALHQLTEIVNLFQLRCSCRFFFIDGNKLCYRFFFFLTMQIKNYLTYFYGIVKGIVLEIKSHEYKQQGSRKFIKFIGSYNFGRIFETKIQLNMLWGSYSNITIFCFVLDLVPLEDLLLISFIMIIIYI